MQPALAGGLSGGVLLASMGLGAWVIPVSALFFWGLGSISLQLAHPETRVFAQLAGVLKRSVASLVALRPQTKLLFALGLTGGVIVADFVFDADPRGHAYLSISAPVVISALLFGFETAGAALLLACAAALYLFIPPKFDFAASDPADVARLMEFVAFVAISTWSLRAMFDAAKRQDAAGIATAGHPSDAIVENDGLLREARQRHHELRHRVRNEFQTLSLLASTEAERSVSPEEFRRWILRLRGLSKLHDMMDGERDERVSARRYIEAMTEALRNSYSDLGVRIETDVDPSLELDYEHARKLAAVFGESTINALKHGFADRAGGTLRVRLSRAGRKCVLSVADDGAGFDPANLQAGYGLRLMTDLAHSMGGEFELRRAERGAVARCVFECG
jgi:two-component sensor histidine kinase